MSNIIIAIFTALATIAAIISLVKSFCNDKERKEIEKEQNEMKLELKSLEQGKAEIEINRLISNSKKDLIDISLLMYNNKCEGKAKEKLLSFYNSYIELELCSYDEACSLYIDRKIDKERFKKSYQVEIRNLFENDNTRTILDSTNCKFHCLKKVYEEWENPEN